MLKTYDDLRSMEEIAAMLPEGEIDELLQDLDPEEIALLEWSWRWQARTDQWEATIDPAGVVGVLAGRGAGKTRTGGEWVRKRTGKGFKARFAFVGRTASDVRDTMIQGESGILACFPPSERPKYVPTSRRVDFVDGSMALCFSAEEPDQLRGPQFHYGWGDELAAWDLRPDDSGLNAWDNLKLATRLGEREGIDPQVLFTTTPKRIKMLRLILKDAATSKRVSIYNQATTYDNRHLREEWMEEIRGIYGGTRLEAQELLGILSDEVEGAMWDEDLIAANRTYDDPGRLPIRIVGVDPTSADNPRDECGIVVLGATPKAGPVLKRTGYVLGDRTIYGPPKKWARRVVETALEFDAIVVAEQNQGGAMVREVVHGINDQIQVKLVWASVNKKARAEPVAAATDQGRLRFFRRFPELEDQMTTWVPDDNTDDSPDRVDALVHAAAGVITLARGSKRHGGRARTSNPVKNRRLGLSILGGR